MVLGPPHFFLVVVVVAVWIGCWFMSFVVVAQDACDDNDHFLPGCSGLDMVAVFCLRPP